MENEFTLSNPTLENEATLTVTLEEVEGVKKLRMEIRNQTMPKNSPIILSTDRHLNYQIGTKAEALALISYLTGLADQM